MTFPVRVVFSIIFVLALAGSVPAQSDLLPDLIVDEQRLSDQSIDTSRLPGRVLFRFGSLLANVGAGEFILQSNSQNAGDGREFVNQVIQLTGGGTRTRDAGEFFFNPLIQRMEAEDWVAYRIREILPDDGVGPILREGQKRVVRITSSSTYDSALTNYKPFGSQLSANVTYGRHGISVGWADLYSQNLDAQWIDITGLAKGTYWLEVVVDAANHVQEFDESNNTTRVMVTLENSAQPDFPAHSADKGGFGVLSLPEVLRVIQLYNTGGHHCEDATEDGYAPGPGRENCQAHSADYGPVDWSINLGELLRVIQIYNAGGYTWCPDAVPSTEDGYCAATG